MSITYFCPEAPTKKIRHEEPDGESWDETISTLPELNMANSNAASFQRAMGFAYEDAGCIDDRAILADFQRKIIRLKNSIKTPFTREPSKEQRTYIDDTEEIPTIKRGITVIDCGLSERQLERYCDVLLDLIQQIQQTPGYTLAWG